MEESGENWPSDSDFEMGDKDLFGFDDEELICDDDERIDPMMGESERKRIQRGLEERLLALSATIPGFNKKKKMENTTILDQVSTYVKQLQQRVRELEQQEVEENSNNKLIASSTSCEEEEVSSYDNNNNNNNNNNYYGGEGGNNNIILPEVKAKVLNNEILVAIHCEKQKGIMVKILSHLENLHLSVLNSSVLPFGKSTLDITIIAQMGDGYNMTVDGLVKSLRLKMLTH